MSHDSDPLLEDDQWDDATNRPKFAKLCVKVIEQERRSWKSILSAAARIATERPPAAAETPWARDLSLVQHDGFLEGALWSGDEHFRALTSAAEEYTENLLLMLKHDRLLIQPAWSAGRGLMEAVLLSCWLLDPTKAPEMRVARALSLVPSVIQGSIDTLMMWPGQEAELAAKLKVRGELIAYYRRNHTEVVWKHDQDGNRTDRTIAVVFRGQKAAFSHNMTQMAGWYLPDEPYLYSLLSGAAHSETWLLGGIKPTSAGEALNSVVMPVLAVSLGLRSVCAYFGIDPQPFIAKNAQRLKALVLWSGSQPERKPDRATAFGTLGSGFLEEFARASRGESPSAGRPQDGVP